MDSDAQRAAADSELRRLTLAELADYLESQRKAATDQWLMAVLRDPEIAAADRLTHQQLLDHLPEIYQECCTFLRTRDAAVLVEDARSDAKTHGEIRWADGYKIDELIRELEVFRGILNNIVLRFSDVDARFRGPIIAAASSLVHKFFGEITVHSVAQYANEQQRVVQTYTSQLESANLELSRANVNLEQALSERQRLIAVVLHEVRTVLHDARLGRPGELTSARSRESTDTQLKDVEDLLGQLLDHTTLIASREPLSAVAFDPAKLHEELMQAYRPAARDKGLALVGGCANGPKRVIADRSRVKQIAANLVSNAIKYTSDGHVSLNFDIRDAERWVMRIADTGPGLETEAAQRLFAAGSTTDTATSPASVPRRGLGLAITKDLVDLLGGSLQVITKIGGGTVFEIVLPLDGGKH